MEDEKPKPLDPPKDFRLPFFAYGNLKPGELGYHWIKEHAFGVPKQCSMDGKLMVRDGLPVLELKSDPGSVSGWLINLGPDSENAYEKICQFEPRSYYQWQEEVINDRPANVLVKRSGSKGNPEKYEHASWTSEDDAFFVEGMVFIKGETDELCDYPFVNDEVFGKGVSTFFRIQATYLLLWSLLERLTAMAFGPALGPSERCIKQLGQCPQWEQALGESSEYLRSTGGVYDANKKDDQSKFDSTKPKNSAKFFYQLRCNISHRGKMRLADPQLASDALYDLTILAEVTMKNLRETARAEKAEIDRRGH